MHSSTAALKANSVGVQPLTRADAKYYQCIAIEDAYHLALQAVRHLAQLQVIDPEMQHSPHLWSLPQSISQAFPGLPQVGK